MNYDQERSAEQLRILDPELTRFVQDYKRGRPTVILLPGGLGSDLQRARQAFHDGDPAQQLDYDIAWLDASILCDAMELGMAGDIDVGDHICIANGPVALLALNPYGTFRRWCDDNAFNYFVLGWDWRRVLGPSVDFFAADFLPALQQRVEAACGEDPLNGFTLVGHSEGGFLVKLFLGSGSPYLQQMAQAVTIATPFYGYAGQLHRYFSGEDYLNDIYGKSAMAQLIASMCGGYELLFTDIPTFLRDQAALEDDTDFPPPVYPCWDLTTGNPVDPYSPDSQPGKVRYPTDNWFLSSQLPIANTVRQQITAPLPTNINAKFYNIRGVQTDDDGAPIDGTAVALSWDWIKPGFDPDANVSPLADVRGTGDDTIPAWSARLVSTPKANIVTVFGEQEDFNHMFLMEQPAILLQLGGLVAPGQPIVMDSLTLAAAPKPASPIETIEFLRRLRAAAIDRMAMRAFLAKYDYRALQSFARRFLMDCMKKPPIRGKRAPQRPRPDAAPRGLR
ncbi:MAG TPA: hypothetical protein VLV85_13980 [Stellaceae bacterium]|nr:hypothetical protein [Stellaceae bacterium]